MRLPSPVWAIVLLATMMSLAAIVIGPVLSELQRQRLVGALVVVLSLTIGLVWLHRKG